MEIKKIAAHYRQYLARMIKQSTRADYTQRLEMLVCYASMQGTTAIEDIDFTQFLKWVFIGRGVAPLDTGYEYWEEWEPVGTHSPHPKQPAHDAIARVVAS